MVDIDVNYLSEAINDKMDRDGDAGETFIWKASGYLAEGEY